MTKVSPRRQFLELLVPRWRVPPCEFGNKHHHELCMGSSVPENLGRRSFYCEPRYPGATVCPSREDHQSSPILPEAERTRLRSALRAFTSAISAGANTQTATAQGLAASDAEAHAQRIARSSAKPPLEVDIFVYLVEDSYIKQRGSVKNGSYSLLLDSAICSLIHFPTSPWSVYDRFRKRFIPIPTFSSLSVVENEFLVIRPTSFIDADCEDLDELLLELESRNLPEPEYPGQAIRDGKRLRGEGNAVAGPSKRRKTSFRVGQFIDLSTD